MSSPHAIDLKRDLAQRLSRQITTLKSIAFDEEAIQCLHEKTGEILEWALAIASPLPENYIRAIPVLPQNCLTPPVAQELTRVSYNKETSPSEPYFLLDVEVGMQTEAMRWEDASLVIEQNFRRPLTSEEIFCLTLSGRRDWYPQPVALGSYCRGNPELTFGIPQDPQGIAIEVVCDEGVNTHWGFPSCAARI